MYFSHSQINTEGEVLWFHLIILYRIELPLNEFLEALCFGPALAHSCLNFSQPLHQLPDHLYHYSGGIFLFPTYSIYSPTYATGPTQSSYDCNRPSHHSDHHLPFTWGYLPIFHPHTSRRAELNFYKLIQLVNEL